MLKGQTLNDYDLKCQLRTSSKRWEQLKQLAKSEGISINSYLNRLIKKHIGGLRGKND